MISTSYDPEADALTVWFGAPGAKSAQTEEVAPGVMLDFDEKGEVIGVEVLDIRRRSRQARTAGVTDAIQPAAE